MLDNGFVPDFEKKILKLEQLVDSRRSFLQPLVFTNGCFDILHRGHVTYLAQAKSLGGILVVAVNSDLSVKMLNKGTDRPINSLQDRMAVLASLADVDFVISFEENTPLNAIKALRPDILVKGGDWNLGNIVGADFVNDIGGSVRSIPILHNTSTTKIIHQINQK